MAFDWKKKLKKGFDKAVETYNKIDKAVEDKKNDALNAIENKIATAGRKKKDAPEAPQPETPKQ